MNRFGMLLVAFALSTTACAAETAHDEGAASSSEDELRSVASGFFVRAPLSGSRVEALRKELGNANDGYAWVQNQGTVVGIQWDVRGQKPLLDDAKRTSLAQAAFAFHVQGNRRYLRNVKLVENTDVALGEALDALGLYASSPDAETDAERAKMLGALKKVASTRNVHVLSASLHYQVDMYWENTLVVIDEDNQQIVIATGGYGT